MRCACGCEGTVTPGRKFQQGHWSKVMSRNVDHSAKWDVDPVTGCWNFNRRLEKNGYGKIRNKWAHVFVYESHGGPIPPGQELDHLCRNRKCVNPAHLEIVTHAENSRRGAKARLTREQVVSIKASLLSGNRATDIAREIGIPPETVFSIKHGRRWADV